MNSDHRTPDPLANMERDITRDASISQRLYLARHEPLSCLQLPLHALRTQHHRLARRPTILHGENLPVVKAAVAGGAAEALVMPLAAQGANVLPDDGRLALTALGRPALGALRLAGHAPRIAVLFDMRHALLERVAALGAEEVPKVPVGAQRHHVLAHDGRLAVLAARGVQLVPVEVAEEAHPFVAVLAHRLAGLVGKNLPRGAAGDAVEACRAVVIGLGRNFERLEGGAAGVTGEALRVEPLRRAGKRYEAAFDEVSALVAASSSSAASRPRGGRPLSTGPCCLPDARGASLGGGEWATRAAARAASAIVGRHNYGYAKSLVCSIRLDYDGRG